MCARCEELEEEVAYLKGELGELTNTTREYETRKRLGLKPQECKLLAALYSARRSGFVAGGYLLDIIEANGKKKTELNDPQRSLLVYIHRIRKQLGRDAIENVWGHGYRLTATGVAVYEAALAI